MHFLTRMIPPYNTQVCEQKKPQATMIFLSATPSVKLRNTPSLTVTKIPRRFHGKPIPLPSFQWIGNWNRLLQKGTIPPKMIRWIQLHADKPRLIFFPSIRALKKMFRNFK